MLEPEKCLCSIPETVQRCTLSPPKEIIQKIRELIECPISMEKSDRIAILMKQYVEASPFGVYLSDIAAVMKTIEYTAGKIHTIPIFKAPLTAMISLLSTPPLLERSSDELNYVNDLDQYFTFLGYLLANISGEEMRMLVFTSTLYLLYGKEPDSGRCVSVAVCQTSIEHSFLPEIVTHLLQICAKEWFPFLIQLANILIQSSPIVCEKMAMLGAVDNVLLRLCPQWNTENELVIPSRPGEVEKFDDDDLADIYAISNFLWGILLRLKRLKKERRWRIEPPKLTQMWCLRYILRVYILTKNCEKKRNDFMAIALMILSVFKSNKAVESGLAEDFALLCVASELGAIGTWAERLRFLPTNEDLTFKKMLILATCYCLRNQACIKIMLDRSVLVGLLKILNTKFLPVNLKWSPTQYKDLLISSLNALAILVPALEEDFIKQNGFTKLIKLVQLYTKEPYEFHIVYAVLKTINSIIPSSNYKLLFYLRSEFTIDILISFCQYILNNQLLSSKNQRALSFVFNILEKLCTRYPDVQNEHGPQSIEIVVATLKRALHPQKGDMLIDNKMLICLGDYLWEAIVWYPHNLKMFVGIGGVYLILDIIEVSIFSVQLIYLAVLVDLCEDGSCIPHIITWRGGKTKQIMILPLLLSIYREESRRLGVGITENGCISDIEFPIMGEEQWFETYYLQKDTMSSPATVDLLGSCRPKVYAIIELLRRRHAEKIEIANQHYKLFHTKFSVIDQVTLEVAGNFLALKLCEVWNEVNRDLDAASVKPLAIDGENINTLTNRHRRWATDILDTQENILRNGYKLDEIHERSLYNMLIENRLEGALRGLRELEFVARTGDHMFRVQTKSKQNEEIEKLLQFPFATEDQNRHRTFMTNAHVTATAELGLNITVNSIQIATNEEIMGQVKPPPREVEDTVHVPPPETSVDDEDVMSVVSDLTI